MQASGEIRGKQPASFAPSFASFAPSFASFAPSFASETIDPYLLPLKPSLDREPLR